MNRRLLAPALGLLLLGALPAPAAPPTTADVPAVVKSLGRRYGVPSGVPGAVTAVEGLAGLVSLQRSVYPQAEVTGRFYDWRTVSRYRRHAGLHLGYDIAMPAGVPVRAGWGGTVVSVAPWSGDEWGITVESPSGVQVTYGHLSPSVGVGDPVQPGSIVGTIASDHVDVKMRDGAGNYVDFGGSGSVAPGPFSGLALTSREARMASWLVARNSLELAEEELDTRRREAAVGSIERRQLERRIAELQEMVPLMAGYVEEGLVSRREAEQARVDLDQARARLKRLKAVQGQGPTGVAALKRQVEAARQRLAMAERVAREAGISWGEVTAFVNATVAQDPRLKEQAEEFKRKQTRTRQEKMADLRREVAEGKRQLAELEDLYQMGGLPRREIEDARDRQKAREAELKALGG